LLIRKLLLNYVSSFEISFIKFIITKPLALLRAIKSSKTEEKIKKA